MRTLAAAILRSLHGRPARVAGTARALDRDATHFGVISVPLLDLGSGPTLRVLAVATLTIALADHAVNSDFPILRPGSRDLELSHIRERKDSTQYALRDAKGNPTGATAYAHIEEHLIDDPAGPAVMIVSSNAGYADTAIVLRSTLRPIREMQHYITRHRTLWFTYDGNRVSIRDSTADSTMKTREHTYDGDVFHFNELDLLIRSLPLRSGYNAILPLYSEGSDALEMDTVQVVGRDERGAWTVRFADPVIVATRTIDGSTRRVLAVKGGRREPAVAPKPPGATR
jgi:hypothetical protein